MSYRQMEHFKKIILKYRDRGVMGLGVKKSKFGCGRVVILVSDDNGNISIAKMMSGISVFARFREKEELHGKNVAEIVDNKSIRTKEEFVIRQAASQIQEKLLNKLASVN